MLPTATFTLLFEENEPEQAQHQHYRKMAVQVALRYHLSIKLLAIISRTIYIQLMNAKTNDTTNALLLDNQLCFATLFGKPGA